MYVGTLGTFNTSREAVQRIRAPSDLARSWRALSRMDGVRLTPPTILLSEEHGCRPSACLPRAIGLAGAGSCGHTLVREPPLPLPTSRTAPSSELSTEETADLLLPKQALMGLPLDLTVGPLRFVGVYICIPISPIWHAPFSPHISAEILFV